MTNTLKSLLVKDWMTKNIVSISPQTSIKGALFLIKKHHIRFLPITEGNKLVGVVTDRDLRSPITSADQTTTLYDLNSTTTVGQVMTTNIISLLENDNLEVAAIKASTKKIGGFPVLEKANSKTLVGVITVTDIMKAFVHVIQAKGL